MSRLSTDQYSFKIEHMSYRIIEVSEIAEYVYCRRAWWLRRIAGREPRNEERLTQGSIYHRNHRTTVRRAGRARQAALVLIFLAVSLIVFWLVTS
jgi:CRISPR/Cas system-associated exonuclease Cas4 (RecB family)